MTSPHLLQKPHFAILHGLRGVAALTVVAFHLLEAHATSHLDLMINHGYLAVDFFFLLSGFVIGYAYDDRWNKITLGEFFKRRLVRLQPMVFIGMLIGALCFYFQDSVLWPTISEVPVSSTLLIMLLGMFLIPVPPSLDIRGWIEMYPLNGPAWTLFFEYIANIFYGVIVRKFSRLALSLLVLVSAAALIHLGVTNPEGDVIGGWALEPMQLYIGFTRLMYPFFAGLLLSRVAKITFINNAFLLASVILISILAMPRIGGSGNVWMNGLYDSLVIILIFPIIVYVGASGDVKGGLSKRFCKFLGEISYPIYITHYPIIYIYTGWVHDHKMHISDSYLVALSAFAACVLLAYASLRIYDQPLRRWLATKLFEKR